jgi:hypothetical protein
VFLIIEDVISSGLVKDLSITTDAIALIIVAHSAVLGGFQELAMYSDCSGVICPIKFLSFCSSVGINIKAAIAVIIRTAESVNNCLVE